MAAVLCVLVSGCTQTTGFSDTTAKTSQGSCCRDVERHPSWLVALAEPSAPLVGRAIAFTSWRKGYLAGKAESEILSTLEPLDVLVVSSKGRLSGHTIPGLFGHMAVYLGNEAELRALGVWEKAAVVRHKEAIRSGALMIEADQDGVHLSQPPRVLNTDRVAVLRPQLTLAGRRRALAALYEHVGSRFDFRFDSGESDCLYCAELVDHVAPELDLPRRRVYGRETIIPDDVAIRAARNQLPLRVRLYVRGERNGWRLASRQELIADIEAEWVRLEGDQTRPQSNW